MKLLFCISGTVNAGGMERVLSQRVNYLVDKFGLYITIVTTENNSILFKNKENFFYFNPKVKIIDLGIKYLDCSNYSFFKRQFLKKFKSIIHLKKLDKVVNDIKPDVLVSVGDLERHIAYKVNYPCKKIIEHHFDKKTFTGERKYQIRFA